MHVCISFNNHGRRQGYRGILPVLYYNDEIVNKHLMTDFVKPATETFTT